MYTRIQELPADSEFVISELVGDGINRDEMRLTFYRKVADIDVKRVEVVLFGCVQIVLDDPTRVESAPLPTGLVDRLKAGFYVMRPRYNNLDDHCTRPMPMSGSYSLAASFDRATLMRLFYRDVRRNVPEAIEQLPVQS